MKRFVSPLPASAQLTALLVLLGIGSYHSIAKAQLTHGPILGHLTSQQATIWARAKTPGTYLLRITGPSTSVTSEADAEAGTDHCLKWTVSKLKPGTRYRYMIQQGSRVLSSGDQYSFATASSGGPTTLRLAFGSCANEDEGSSAVWRRIKKLDPQAVILLGDTPYIDSVDLKVQRQRHGAFLGVPAFQELVAGRSLYATWDDHDFGRNDTNGNLPGKENSRRAFVEYHANPSYGDGKQGIYTKVSPRKRRGFPPGHTFFCRHRDVIDRSGQNQACWASNNGSGCWTASNNRRLISRYWPAAWSGTTLSDLANRTSGEPTHMNARPSSVSSVTNRFLVWSS